MNVELWGWYSIGINIILILINLVIARASSSLAVEAEMVHNVVDFFTAVGVLIGLKLSTRKSKDFPYGLYKIENVITVVLAGMTFFTAYEITRDALFATERQTTVDTWMLIGVIIAAAIPLIFSTFELRVGKRANSPALIADAKEYRVHIFTTGITFAALVGQWVNLPLDRVAALVIVVAIAKTGWELLSDGMRVLLDASLDANSLLKIREIITEEPTVVKIDWVTGRNAGRFRFVEAAVILRVHDLAKAETVIQRIKAQIQEAVPFVERVLIHAEPQERTHLRYAAPLADHAGSLSEHFGEAPYFALGRMRLSDGHVDEERIVDTPGAEMEKARGIYVAEWLVDQKVDVVLLKQEMRGKGPVYVFGDANVEMREVETDNLAKALARLYE